MTSITRKPIYLAAAAFTIVIGMSSPAKAEDTRPVTQDQFKEVLRIFKKVVERFDAMEAKINSSQNKEEAVDLDQVGKSAPTASSIAAHADLAKSTQSMPGFRTYFDLNLVNQPGVREFTFDSFHTFLMFEIMPTPEIQFSFEVNPSPRYFELDYQVAKWIQFRWGKIWIPFDDMSPHNIFGGRVNVSRLAASYSTGSNAFLPDLWTDLGVGAKLQLWDGMSLSSTLDLYVVNGFRAGGTDPLKPSGGSEIYPNFSDLQIAADNNRDKAVGGRLHTLLFKRWGLGVSYYNGRWSSQSKDPLRAGILGLDSQVRFGGTELRAGLASFSVALPDRRLQRAGLYAEAGQKFGPTQAWKALARGGLVQMDDGALNDPTDQTLAGMTLLYKPGLIQYSIEYSRDLKVVEGKKTYSYTAFRIVTAL